MTDRILVTGAQGFLGRYLTAHLIQTYPVADILGLGRSIRLEDDFTHSIQWGTSGLRAPLPEKIRETLRSRHYEYVSLDIGHQPELSGLLGDFQPQLIFHLASGLRDAPPDHLFRTNVEGTISLLEAIREAGIEIEKLVLGSTGFLYGRIPSGMLPIHESTPCAPIDLYGVSKLAAENASRILADRYKLPVMWARIFNLVGPGQEERHFCGKMTSQAAAISAGLLPPRIEVEPLTTTRDFLDVRDAALALASLARDGMSGCIYNVASGVESPIAVAFQMILRNAGLEGKVDVVLKPARSADIPRYVADVSRLRAMGFSPEHCLSQSLTDLMAYYCGAVAERVRRGGRRELRSRIFASVEAARAHRYSVEIEAGLLDTLPDRLQGLFPTARMVVLTDECVLRLHGLCLLERLRARGVEVDVMLLPEGEPSKSADQYLELIKQLHAFGFDRRALLINLGGGIVTDVGGFVAATYLRGVAYVNVPTTLLAQLDAAIGGKVAVNMPWAKNFVGAFAHPRAVFSDPAVIRTLPPREISAGIAEALKISIIGDPELFELLEGESVAVREGKDARLMGEVVARATEGKIRMLAPDPYENNLRRVLNLGHTFGHALEVQTGYAQLRHGEAVSFGLAVATAIARRRGLCSQTTLDRVFRAIHAYGLPPGVARTDLLGACNRLDAIRLVRARKLNFVLPVEIGRVEIVAEVADAEINESVNDIAVHPVLGGCVVEQ